MHPSLFRRLPTLCGAQLLLLVALFTGAAPTCPENPKTLYPPPSEDPVPYQEGSFTVVVLPDTQYALLSSDTAKFDRQIDWILDQRRSRQILAVVTLGDSTEHNRAEEWARFGRGMQRLREHGLPTLVTLGNHDYSDLSRRDSSLFGDYFHDPDFASSSVVFEAFDDPLGPAVRHNYALLLTIPDETRFGVNAGNNVGLLTLEFGPRDEVLVWAERLLSSYPDHTFIVATHTYLYVEADGDPTTVARYDAGGPRVQSWNPHDYAGMPPFHAPPSPYPTSPFDLLDDLGYPSGYHGNDGQELWDKLLRHHTNVALVLSGHVYHPRATGHLASRGDRGNLVHELLSDYQLCSNCGEGGHSSVLRLLEFHPDGRGLQVKSYSPLGGNWMIGENDQFSLRLRD